MMDPELLSYLDRKFGETAAQILALREETTQRFEQIDQRFEQIDQRFGQIDQRFGQIDQRFGQIDQRFEAIDRRFEQIDQRFEAIDRRLDGFDRRFEEAESRFDRLESEIRHAHVAIEDLRGQIRLVADGVAMVDGKMDRLADDTARRFDEQQSLIRLSYGQLERRLSDLEGQVVKLDRRVYVLESSPRPAAPPQATI
jgi:chromosome segregation ATPase